MQVVDVYFPKDRATNRRKNFCFVTFATQQASSRLRSSTVGVVRVLLKPGSK